MRVVKTPKLVADEGESDMKDRVLGIPASASGNYQRFATYITEKLLGVYV